MEDKRLAWSRVAVSAVLAAITLVTFSPVLDHDFTGFDDDVYVTANPSIQQGLTASSLRWAWTTMDASNWHPLTWISHMVDWRLYGGAPAGHHLSSLLLHVLNVLLLFVVLDRATARMARSAAVAVLFAIHPLHVESVAWIAERKDVLSTFFWLLTMLAYVAYVKRPSAGRYALVVVLFALGLCAKPMLVTLPLVLLLLDYWPLERYGKSPEFRGANAKRLFAEKLPLLALSAASSVVTAVAQGRGKAIASLAEIPLLERIGNAVVSYIAYLIKTVWPARLAVHYPHPRGDLGAIVMIGCLAAIVVATLAAARYRRRYPYLAVGWLWYLGTLVPVIGLVQVGEQAMADRYTYVPLIGIFIVVCWGVADATRMGELVRSRSPRRRLVQAAASVLSMIVVASLALTARAQVAVWQDALTLFEHAVAVTEGSSVAHANLARALEDRERYPEAIEQYREALEIDPYWGAAHNRLGSLLVLEGRPDEAARHFEQALRLDPDDADARNNLGTVLLDRGDIDAAIVQLTRAVRIDPDNDIALINLGRALARTGRLRAAIESYRTALEINPDSSKAHASLGDTLAAMGREPEAIAHYEQALRISPATPETHNNLATVLHGQGRLDEAIRHLEEAVRLRPDYGVAHANLAAGYLAAGRYAEAWTEVRLAERHGARPPESVLLLLEQKMPEPARDKVDSSP